jgi:hypothetical protein
MPLDFRSQMDLPIAADHEKSPIRKQELDDHANAELHIQNDGLLGQMLVMTSLGPRMMFPKLHCKCDDSHYGCDCRIVFDDDPPPTAADVVIRCYKNGDQLVPNESHLLNVPAWTLEFEEVGFAGTFFRFVPEKVFDCDLSQLEWYIGNIGSSHLGYYYRQIDGKRCFDVAWAGDVSTPVDDYLVAGDGQTLSTWTERMRITIKKVSP